MAPEIRVGPRKMESRTMGVNELGIAVDDHIHRVSSRTAEKDTRAASSRTLRLTPGSPLLSRRRVALPWPFSS